MHIAFPQCEPSALLESIRWERHTDGGHAEGTELHFGPVARGRTLILDGRVTRLQPRSNTSCCSTAEGTRSVETIPVESLRFSNDWAMHQRM